MQSLIKHDKNDPLVIAGVLAHQILPQIASALPALRDSYRDFIATVVPSSFTPSLEDCKILLSLLSNPDPQILRCGINITLHFAANFQFRRMICQSNFSAVAVEAFRRGATATDTLALITEFAKYEDLRQAMIDLRSGIVQELLTMMKRGTADLDRWQIGLKGSIALNLL
ncbi:hypothetical protein C8R46DRAFT_308535 [Mycena filopes]|nr:hypothetical protein C8R46DRAFT_308535 [Mycena filopes]